ncbi:MAG: phosphodiester glycosidase family protein [Clostridia bacterium]|nr:phosphodiester glycosidase family protein [Clostridia bacterium]
MRKLIAILLLMTMLIPAALADEAADFALPMDHSAGHVADPAGYTESGYEDESLSITMERIQEDGVTYNVARVKIAHASQLRTGLEDPEKGKKSNYVHNIAARYNAVLALSGDFFVKNKVGYVVRQGQVYRKKPTEARDMLLIDSNGDFHVVYRSNAEDLQALLSRTDVTFPNIFNFGPVLVDKGEAVAIPEKYEFNLKRYEPRCAIGQVGPLEYLLVVADGRSDTSTGAKGEQLASFMASQGCITAYNLDGGDTALLWFGGDYYSRKTKRAQSDIIYFATAVDAGLDGTEE